MSITMIPIHKDGAHQRSLQVKSVNDAYIEVRRHADQQFTGRMLNSNVLFHSGDYNPIVKFVIINGDKVEIVDVKGFKKIKV